MNKYSLPRGRSEGSKGILDRVPGLKWLLFLVQGLFGTFDWSLAEVVGECKLTPADTIAEAADTGGGFPIGSILHTRLRLTKQVPLRINALIQNKGLQLRRAGQRFDWSAVRVVTESLIKFSPRLIQWRDNMGWRGPPWALFAALNIVRLQE